MNYSTGQIPYQTHYLLKNNLYFQHLTGLILIFSLITGSVVGLSYWVTATTVGTAVRHSSQITRAVYPKLLSGGRKEFLQSNLIN